MAPDRSTPDTTPPTGGERRRLDRAPGERYASPGRGAGAGTAGAGAAGAGTAGAATGGGTRWIVAAVIVADLGALAFFVLGLLDLGFGLVAVAAFVGWATAIALVYRGREAAIRSQEVRIATAAFLGGWSVVAGMLIDWLFGLTQGGVMDFVSYVAERYWLVAPAALVAGAFVAAYRAR
jgi:hypothetical protein